jgi:hypothetical protein
VSRHHQKQRSKTSFDVVVVAANGRSHGKNTFSTYHYNLLDVLIEHEHY